MQFRGTYVAIITPFDRKGRIDRKALESLIEWHIQEGTDGIVCCGSTGEGVALSDAEKKTVVKICVYTAANRIPIIASSGLPGTQQSVRLTEQMQQLGAKGCLIVTPFYNKPSQRGCIQHFQEIAKVGLPIIVYHNPGRSTVCLSAETIAEISEIHGVAALKESSRDLELIRKVRKLCQIPILAGDDDMTLEILQEGGVGAISVIGNLFPKSWEEMIHFALCGEWKSAKAIVNRYMPLCRALFIETNPQGIKFAMQWLGRSPGYLRLPLVPVSEGTQNEIKRILIALSLPQMERVEITQEFH